MTVRPWHEDLDDEDYEVMRLEAEEDRIVTGPQEKPTALDRIEATATAADDDGRAWEWEHAYPQRVTRVGDVVVVADCFEDPDSPSRFAEFIATCDPPTVLALVAVARAAQEHLEHTIRFCVDKDEEADLTCPTHRALASALARLDMSAEGGAR